MTRQYWISTNPNDPTFDTPEAAIEDWMQHADTIPSAVSWTAEDGSQGVVGVEAQDWQRGPYWII